MLQHHVFILMAYRHECNKLGGSGSGHSADAALITVGRMPELAGYTIAKTLADLHNTLERNF